MRRLFRCPVSYPGGEKFSSEPEVDQKNEKEGG
jgi:hypothetical protein